MYAINKKSYEHILRCKNTQTIFKKQDVTTHPNFSWGICSWISSMIAQNLGSIFKITQKIHFKTENTWLLKHSHFS